MTLFQVSYIFYVGIWLIPPFRQRTTKYLNYFIVLALSEITSFVLFLFFNIDQYLIFIFYSYLLVISIIQLNYIKRFSILFLILGLCTIIISLFFPNIKHFIFVSLHLIILIIFLKSFILEMLNKKIFLLFGLLLIFYELTIISKYLNLFTGMTDAYTYFIITSIFQILFGLFFSLFKAGDNRLFIQLK